ncbi:MAG TPA: hypothetical protein VM344_05365 [Vitreimonas sp.]|nr:hypothetical protein [Vitreimonas sp.]
MGPDATDIEEHLRAASDAILLLLTEAGQLERHKRDIPPGEPRFDEVARSVRIVAKALADFAETEEQWARIATDGRTDIAPIATSENAPALAEILERWRAIERQLDDVEPGSPASDRLFAEFERTRDEYMAAFRARNIDDPQRGEGTGETDEDAGP